MGRRERCIAQIRRLKPEKSLGRLTRHMLEVYERRYWKRYACRSFADWGRKTLGFGRSQIYAYLKIGRCLSSLREAEIDALGVNKCLQLARLAEGTGRPDGTWLRKAKHLDTGALKVAVESELPQDRKPEEFGELLDPSFRGLVHAPVNEQGVVYLFGMVSRELGFIVEKVRQGYPDCIAKRVVSEQPQRWRQVRVEFEYRSSAFNHPPRGSDLIVCWEDDLGPKAPLLVLELKSEIKKLPNR